MTSSCIDNSSIRRWEELARSAPAWEPFDAPLLVVVPHPDDETLLTGALIARQVRAGRDVSIVSVTDGDAAYGPSDPVLAERRRREQDAAVEALGLSARHIERLGLPDSQVAEHEDAVAAAIADLVGPDTVVVAPWTGDVHPDHEACGRAALVGAGRRASEVIFGVFWACHRLDPDRVEAEFDTLAIDVDEELARRLDAALRCHASQFARDDGQPILDEELIAPVTWSRQVFLRPVAK